MTLRPATAADAVQVAALEQALFGVDAWSGDTVADELAGAGRDAVVAIDGDELVGYAVTLRVGEVADLQRIAVRADRQRQGVARLLLREVLDRAGAAGAERVLLEVGAANEPALGLYRRAGFTEISRRRRYYRDGSDAVVMEHSLATPDGERG